MQVEKKVFLNHIPNREIMGKGISFYNAANVLYESPPNLYVASPYIMCAAFAVEVLFKSLNAQTLCLSSDSRTDIENNITHYENLFSESSLDGHSHKSLFEELPLGMQTILRQQYSESNFPYNFKTIDEALSHSDKSFINSRYSYEKSYSIPFQPTVLRHLLELLYQFTLELYAQNHPQIKL